MLDRKNYKYIYSVNFANYLMTQGIMCRGTGISPKTGKYFWAFDYDECQPVYEKLNKKEENENQEGHFGRTTCKKPL